MNRAPGDIAEGTYLNHSLEKLEHWGMTVTEDMDPAAAEKYVFKRF